jgi:hypothetical protein
MALYIPGDGGGGGDSIGLPFQRDCCSTMAWGVRWECCLRTWSRTCFQVIKMEVRRGHTFLASKC